MQFAPALRSVASNGITVTRAVADLRILFSTGPGPPAPLVIASAEPVEYVPEIQYDYLNAGYSMRWRLLGYRPIIRIQFHFLPPTNLTTGLSLIQSFWQDGMESESYAALQFNLFWTNPASPWRGIRPTTNWAPQLVPPGKETSSGGFEQRIEATCVDLVSPAGIGRWSSSNW